MKKIFSFGTCVALTVLALSVQAATFQVNSLLDEKDLNPGDGVCRSSSQVCTLRAAIEEADARTSIDKINIPEGRYRLQKPIDVVRGESLRIRNSVTIIGAGLGRTFIDASQLNNRAFNLIGPTSARRYNVTLKDLSVEGGLALDGAGILASPNTVLYLDAVRLAFNQTWPEWRLNEQDIGRNGGNGAALAVETDFGFVELGSVKLNACIIEDNNGSEGAAGAIYITNSLRVAPWFLNMPLEISNSTIRRNSALQDAGAIYALNLTVSFSLIDDNHLFVEGVQGAGAIQTTDLTMTSSTVSNNSSPASGGAILLAMDPLDGDWQKRVSITNSTFSSNRSTTTAGGAIAIFDSLWDEDGPEISILHSTFFDNHSVEGAPALMYDGDELEPVVELQNNIFWANQVDEIHGEPVAAAFADIYNYNGDNDEYCGAFSSLGGNFFADLDGCNAFAADETDRIGLDPLLGVLRNNGGKTPTHALRAASPAIDAVPCLANVLRDQRNTLRPQRAQCDSGSYELK